MTTQDNRPHVAREIDISYANGIRIDGEMLPWAIAEGWTVTRDRSGICYFNVSIFADRITVAEST
jgi:hypothetical protein